MRDKDATPTQGVPLREFREHVKREERLQSGVLRMVVVLALLIVILIALVTAQLALYEWG